MNTDDLNTITAWLHYYAPEPLKTKLKMLLEEHDALWNVVNSMTPNYISAWSNESDIALADLKALVMRN